MQSRRDVGNEVIVALAVIGMLALALTFGVVLTLTRQVPPEGTGTVVTISTEAATSQPTETTKTDLPTDAPTDAATQAATQAVTVTATFAVTDEATVAATVEATTTETAVAQVATATSTNSATIPPTVVPTIEPTRIVYPTRRPRTATSTVTSTPTPIPSATSIPPTYPRRRTRTPSPVSPVAPTLVPTTPAAESTATRVVDAGILPTPTPTITPTVLATLTTTPLPTIAIATTCAPRTDWIQYTVQPGDTLFNIAVQARITLAQLQQANCISNPNTIFFGRVIVIPPGTVISTALPGTPGTTPASGSGNAALCPNPDLRITNPISGSKFTNILSISGTARTANFANYQIEFQPEGTVDWVRTAYSSTPVTNGLLGRFDPNPSQLPAGNFALRLRIEVTSGSPPPPCVIKVTLVK